MKKTIFFSLSLFALILGSCGPAAEDRQMMHARAKVFQDSIANIIKTSMAEAEGTPNNVVTMQAPAPAASESATSSPNPNMK